MFKAPNTPSNLMQNWTFGIEIDGFESAYFQKCKLPEINVKSVEFNPAGSLFPQKFAGRVTFDNATLEKGIIADGTDRSALEWLNTIIDVDNQTGGEPIDYMKDIDIIEFNRKGEEVSRTTLHGAFITKRSKSEKDGGNDDVSIETLEIACQYTTEI